MSGNIQQQLYTRERGGIFHSTDGYDSIAISDGLDSAFVKKYLHPFCMYHAPKMLTEKGEKDSSLYPPAVTLFQPETGDLVIGQAVFVPADFTGSRSTFFMHSYVVLAAQKDLWIVHPEKIFQINEFQSSYDISQGQSLPGLEAVGYGESDVLSVKETCLKMCGMNEDEFKQLLFAVMSAIAGKKKVFISLPVPLQDYSKAALELLELVYLYLPYAHRRRLGVLTFTSQPETKNYIHVTFFEPGTLNLADRSIEKQFIFDFAGGRVYGADLLGRQHEYLDFALQQFKASQRIDGFFEFAEKAMAGLSDEDILPISSYHQLTDIYLTLVHRDTRYFAKNKTGFLHSLANFLKVKSEEKTELSGLFLNLLHVEKVAADRDSALGFIQAVVRLNAYVQSDEALSFIVETLKNYQSDSLFQGLWKVIGQDRLFYSALVTYMNEHPDVEFLLEQYFEGLFKPLVLAQDILKECKRMLETPYLLAVNSFKSVVRRELSAAVGAEGNPFKAVQAVRAFTREVPQPEFGEFTSELLAHAKLALLHSIRLQDLSLQDVLAFGGIFSKKIIGNDLKDPQATSNYLITDTLYQLVSSPSQAPFLNLQGLTGAQRVRLRDTLNRLLQTNSDPEFIPLLPIAFGSESGGVDYQGVFEHLSRHYEGKKVLSFIRGNLRLLDVDPEFNKALRTYLIRHPNSIWKSKTLRKELKLIRNNQFKHLLNAVEQETASPFVRFFKKNV